jgi:hypothetical protein
LPRAAVVSRFARLIRVWQATTELDDGEREDQRTDGPRDGHEHREQASQHDETAAAAEPLLEAGW